MNRGRAIAIIKRDLGFKTTLDDEISAAIDDAQEHYETAWAWGELPWFMLSDREILTATADVETIAVPADFVQETEYDGIWLQVDTGGERLLRKYDLDDLRKADQARFNYGETTQTLNDTPLSYALEGENFFFFPKPLSALTFRAMYYKRLALTVDSTDTNGWLTEAPWCIIGHAGERIASALRDKEAEAKFQQYKAGGIETLTQRISDRRLANRRMAMGETR